jgi:hypothetical protein
MSIVSLDCVGRRCHSRSCSAQNKERRPLCAAVSSFAAVRRCYFVLEQMRQAIEQKVSVGMVLADAAYGNGTQFRAAVSELGWQYTVAIESSTTIK